MTMIQENKSPESVQESLLVVQELLRKHELVESLAHKQNLAELRAKLDELHPADVAYILLNPRLR